MKMETERLPIPTWSLCYIINGDESGLEFGEKEMIDDWMKNNGILGVFCPDDIDNEQYFTSFPPFGLACEVVECECVLEW